MNKKEFIETLIGIGGCGAEPGTWDRGWDEAVSEVLGIAEELDEPETLSQEWIDDHKVARIDNLRKMTTSDVVTVENLKNLLVTKQDKPVIPQHVADWIEEERATIIDWHTEVPERFFLILGHKLNYTTLASTNIGDWVFGGNEEKLYQSLKYGYEVEKEKLYRVVFPYKGEKVYLKEGVHGDFDVIETETYGTQYTESEIKVIDERYWAFAEEVTE